MSYALHWESNAFISWQPVSLPAALLQGWMINLLRPKFVHWQITSKRSVFTARKWVWGYSEWERDVAWKETRRLRGAVCRHVYIYSRWIMEIFAKHNVFRLRRFNPPPQQFLVRRHAGLKKKPWNFIFVWIWHGVQEVACLVIDCPPYDLPLHDAARPSSNWSASRKKARGMKPGTK